MPRVWAPQLPGWTRLGAVSFHSDGLVLRREPDAPTAADGDETDGSDDEMPVEWGSGSGGGVAAPKRAAGDDSDDADTEAGSEGDESERVVSAQRLEAEAQRRGGAAAQDELSGLLRECQEYDQRRQQRGAPRRQQRPRDALLA